MQYILSYSAKSEILYNINYHQISKFDIKRYTFYAWNIWKTPIREYWTLIISYNNFKNPFLFLKISLFHE